MGVTKYILKHPVTTVMALLCLVVFGISSVFSAKLEQMPDMETPMLIIMANYSGAGLDAFDDASCRRMILLHRMPEHIAERHDDDCRE